MRISTRPIAPTDAEIIAALHAASWRDSYRGMLRDAYLDSDVVADRRTVWQQRLSPPDPLHFGFVAEQDRRPVGFVFLKGLFDPTWGTLLDNLHVLPGFKGRGIGQLLIEAAARETQRRHAGAGIYLWVFVQNTPARRFYSRLGGKEVEQVIIEPPGGGKVPEWRVVWPNPAELLSATQSFNAPDQTARPAL
jgi:ribosomal protein S18 acetylase RimI-like enzyme